MGVGATFRHSTEIGIGLLNFKLISKYIVRRRSYIFVLNFYFIINLDESLGARLDISVATEIASSRSHL